MAFYELWIGKLTTRMLFRAQVAAPSGSDVPSWLVPDILQTIDGKTIFHGNWYSGLRKAKQDVDSIAGYLHENGEQFLIYSEIRDVSAEEFADELDAISKTLNEIQDEKITVDEDVSLSDIPPDFGDTLSKLDQ